jgi:hypothetical protein
MTKQIETVRKTRTYLIEHVKDLNADQMNHIFAGFNNNIIWNLGHMVATQQGICYKRAGLPTLIDDTIWEKFRSGSKPQGMTSDNEIDYIKQMLLTCLDQLERDYQFNKKIFDNYTAWTNRYGVELASIEDGIEFMQFHEGLHSGTIMTMKRMLNA